MICSLRSEVEPFICSSSVLSMDEVKNGAPKKSDSIQTISREMHSVMSCKNRHLSTEERKRKALKQWITRFRTIDYLASFHNIERWTTKGSKKKSNDSCRPETSFILPKVQIPQMYESNEFLEHYIVAHPLTGLEHWKKQLKFQKTLLDVQKAFLFCNLPFFLACGTALGAHREGGFIHHDEDIDIGVIYNQLVSLGERKKSASTTFFRNEYESHGTPLFSQISDNNNKSRVEDDTASTGCVELLSALSHLSNVQIFDICGCVSKGLEIRVQHIATRVRVDINIYYPPIENDDDELVKNKGDFVWAASFYEKAMLRKHHMYRYMHTPFDSSLFKIPFCAISRNVSADYYFLVPPENYLDEYFSKDWRKPRCFSYIHGLNCEFANIIEE